LDNIIISTYPADPISLGGTFQGGITKGNESLPLHKILGMAKYEYEAYENNPTEAFINKIINRRRPEGRITVFYIRLQRGNIVASFSFCSPEDVKLGAFNKKEGRIRAFNRFYGLDGESICRITLEASYSDKVYNVINGLLKDIACSYHTKTNDNDIGERPYVLRTIVADNVNQQTDIINTFVVNVHGKIKVPNWLVVTDVPFRQNIMQEAIQII
jgi:hypothetical protein